MTGLWTLSYVLLWSIVLAMTALLVGVLYEVGLLRRERQSARSRENGPKVGSALEPLKLESANGFGPVVLGNTDSGLWTLLVFMGPVCQACHTVVDTINELAGGSEWRYLKVIVVVSGHEPGCMAFLQVFPLRVPVVIDADHRIARDLSILLTPSELLYNAAGSLVAKESGPDIERLLAIVWTGPGDGNPASDSPDTMKRPALAGSERPR